MKKLVIFATFIQAQAAGMAQDYQGASAIARQLADKAGEKPAEKKADPVEELRLKVQALRKDAASLGAAEGATRWMALLDAYLTIPSDQLYSHRAYEDRLSLAQIITALPPPTAWDELKRLLENRKTANPLQDETLRLLIAVLRNDEADRKQALERTREALSAQKKLEDYQRDNYKESINEIEQELERLAGSEASKIRAFEERLGLLEKKDEKTVQMHGRYLEVPDLARFSDEKTATSLLTRVLKLDAEALSIEGNTTQMLAASLALKNIASIKKPLWNLVHALDHAPLYEALAAKFPDDRSRERKNASRIYLLALIAANRADDAAKLVRQMAEEAHEDNLRIDFDHLDHLQRQGLGKQVLAFLHRLLTDDPQLLLWTDYIELSAHQNASAEALRLLQAGLAKPSITPKARTEMQSHLYLALLAADQREEGIQILRELVKAGPRSGANEGAAQAQETRKRWEQVGVHVTPEMIERFQQEAGGRMDGGESEHIRLCMKMAEIGRLLGKPGLINEGMAAAEETLGKMPATDSNRKHCVHLLVTFLMDHQRGPEAEKLLIEHLATMVKPDEKQRGRRDMSDSLGLLAALYGRAGRHKDALEVFELLPYWNAPDLAAFESTSAGDEPLLLIAARALAETGRKEDARRVIRRAVQDYPAEDDVYELLLRVGSEEPLEQLLDNLAKRDRFQERPLIWKARVLLDAGKTDEAEKAARAAIAIDPSDGEQGKGDRMRAYAILAEVLDKKGDAGTAKVMRGAVSAIRKSEEADDWWEAGLLGEAVRRYEAALLDFADAYCIQSRLALRYSELGQLEKAEQHYLRAFELMPDSFGRVESHCFGCEGAFRGQSAQNVADKVFTRLASVPPVKAQVHYLLGYLRESQDRNMEAADAYRQAVKTDPDYLNAWKELASLADSVQMTREESENAALQIFRLDPAGHHASHHLQDLRDLRRLWSTLLAAEAGLPVTETGPLLPLPAAKAAIEASKNQGGNAWETWSYPSLFSRQNEPRNHLLENSLIRAAVQFIERISRQY